MNDIMCIIVLSDNDDYCDFYKKVTFFVTYNSEDCDIHCSCQMFSFKGIQCSHVLSVLSHNGVRELPEKYILRRWRKDVKRCHTKVKVGFSCWKNDDASKQYYDLCNQFGELADWVAGTSQYPEINDWLACKKKEVQQIMIKAKESEKLKGKQFEENIVDTVDINGESEEGDDTVITVNDPLRKPRRGRTRKTVD
ncbi:hypothetical protein MKW98_006215 [Papaver atlanticum]|uniref:Protein FAR1-RELATED SEQUENCE n=1 Tax=Papaver atlanticum TaxID=357466 RepID=A0AAD4TH01_9MAGN|nr:hypothetical protein MKW98_006215 [Papaver atlanticum]